MAFKTDTSTAGRSDPSTVSAAALRLDPLLRKIRDGLSEYLEAFALAIQGARLQDINWPLFMVVVPDPGDGGTIDFGQQEAGDFVGFDNFCICRFNIPVSEADIETAASYLRHCGLDPDAQRLLEGFEGLKAAFCSVVEFIPLSDGSSANRKFLAQNLALMLSEHLEDLIRTLPTILTSGGSEPPAELRSLCTARQLRLIDLLWKVKTATHDEAIEAVWGKDSTHTSDNVHTLVRELKTKLRKTQWIIDSSVAKRLTLKRWDKTLNGS